MTKEATIERKPETDELLGDFWTKDEMAAMCGKKTRTLDYWHRNRIGPPRTKFGTTVLYRKESARAWLVAQEEKTSRSASN